MRSAYFTQRTEAVAAAGARLELARDVVGRWPSVAQVGVDAGGVVRVKVNPAYFRPTEVRAASDPLPRSARFFRARPARASG